MSFYRVSSTKSRKKFIILIAFQVSGALPFGIRPRSRITIRSSGSPLERLPEFLKSEESISRKPSSSAVDARTPQKMNLQVAALSFPHGLLYRYSAHVESRLQDF